MPSQNTLSGYRGHFTVGGIRVARCTRWDVNGKLAHVAEWGDSDSNGYTNRLAGRWDSLFGADGKFDTLSEFYNIFDVGDFLAVKLYLNDELFWNFSRGVCLDYKLVVDIDREDVIGWTSSWGSDGEFYYPGESY